MNTSTTIQLGVVLRKTLRTIAAYTKKGQKQTPEDKAFQGDYSIIHLFGGKVYRGNYSTYLEERDVLNLHKLGLLESISESEKRFRLSDAGKETINELFKK